MFNLIKFYRVDEWFHLIGFIVLGFALRAPLNIGFIKYGFMGSFLLAYAFSVNDFYDEKGKKPFFLVPLLISLIMLPLFNVRQITVSILFIILFTFYSAEPFRFKSKPFINTICNNLGFITLFFLGYFITESITSPVLFSLLFLSLQTPSQLLHEASHSTKDEKEGVITTGVFIGKEKIKKLIFVFLLTDFLLVLYFLHINLVNLFFVLTTVGFIIFFTVRMRSNDFDLLRSEYRVYSTILGIVYLFIFMGGGFIENFG